MLDLYVSSNYALNPSILTSIFNTGLRITSMKEDQSPLKGIYNFV